MSIPEFKDKIAALIDFDGFGGGPAHPDLRFIPAVNFHAFRELSKILIPNVVAVTNRPPTVATIMADMVSSHIACAESGGSFVIGEKIFLNPIYREYTLHVRTPLNEFVKDFFRRANKKKNIRELPGNIVTSCFYARPKINIGSLLKDAGAAVQEEFGDEILVSNPKDGALDIWPAQPIPLIKARATEALNNGMYHAATGKNMPTKIIMGDDSGRAGEDWFEHALKIPGLKPYFITVANASPDLKTWVLAHNGYVSPKPYTEGVSDAMVHAFNEMGIQTASKSTGWKIVVDTDLVK